MFGLYSSEYQFTEDRTFRTQNPLNFPMNQNKERGKRRGAPMEARLAGCQWRAVNTRQGAAAAGSYPREQSRHGALAAQCPPCSHYHNFTAIVIEIGDREMDRYTFNSSGSWEEKWCVKWYKNCCDCNIWTEVSSLCQHLQSVSFVTNFPLLSSPHKIETINIKPRAVMCLQLMPVSPASSQLVVWF